MILSAALDGASTAADTTAALVNVPRQIEKLGRGVVAVRSSNTQILVSWRLLALDPAGMGFNVYRAANGGTPVKLNATPLTGGTNYTDTTANFAASNAYHVRAVIAGVEQPPSKAFTLTANHAVEPVIRVPLRDPRPGYTTKFVWVGDLDGDGEFDYVIDRLTGSTPLTNQYLEAYRSDGTFLWEIDLGHTSTNTYNIEPGAATLSVGNWDGATVADMDGDGRAEVLLKTANGVKFADGKVLTAAHDNLQYISVVNGLTGAERARIQFANDYIVDGAMGVMFGVGSVDGVRPALYVKGKNRVGNGGFNQTVQAYAFNGSALTRLWKWNRNNTNAPDGHQFRIIDVDGDGKDEFCDIGFTLNSNGTFRYSLNQTGGVIHGDRFHIGDFDPDRPGLEGYGVQQSNPNGMYDYYYDANTGQMLWQRYNLPGPGPDVGRGMASDIDPRHRGFEVWAFEGVYNAPTHTKISNNRPYPQLSMQWDGDVLGENLNDGKIENWEYATDGVSRLVTQWTYDSQDSGALPMFYGDLWGDWREEVVTFNNAWNGLTIFSTNVPTQQRLYTLAQNPAYRNCMTLKGYYQSNQLDYYLGDGMTTPPTPAVTYPGGPLAVQASEFDHQTSPHKLRFRFSSNVAANLGVQDLTVTRDGVVGTVTPSGYMYDALTNTATFTFATPLADGNYTATLNAAGFSDAAGGKLAADHRLQFFTLQGDFNRDRTVDFADLLVLAQNYGSSGHNVAAGNADLDVAGQVNFADLLILAQRYGTSLISPRASSVVSTASNAPRERGVVRVALVDDEGDTSSARTIVL